MSNFFTSEKQLLITGCYRSGTEYASLLLNNHPDLNVSMYVVSYLRFCYKRYGDININSNLNKLLFDVAERIRTRYNIKLDPHAILNQCEQTAHVTDAFVYDSIMSQLFCNQKVRFWGEKVQLVWSRIPDFLSMFPDGKAIVVIRDPRSVLASFKRFTAAPEPAYLGAVFNSLDALAKAIEYSSSYPGRCAVLKFEDLICNPTQALVQLFEFLELSTSHDLLSQEGWVDAYGAPWTHNTVFTDTITRGAFDTKSAISRWKNNTSNADIGLCEHICKDVMQHFGYPLSSPEVSWEEMIAPLLESEPTMKMLQGWLETRKGVEAFPTDPLAPENWTENITAKE